MLTRIVDSLTVSQRQHRLPTADASPYSALNSTSRQIRLFKIHKSRWGPQVERQLRCRMKITSLQKAPAYRCISYRWGDPEHTELIILNDKEVRITINLAAALRTFANQDQKELWYWADAICINQQDNDERSAQVAMMHEIFAQAEEVRAWLPWPHANNGLEAHEIHEHLQCGLGLCVNYKTSDDIMLEQECLPIEFVAQLFEDPYWQRSWVFQELAVADSVMLYYGEKTHELSRRLRRSIVYGVAHYLRVISQRIGVADTSANTSMKVSRTRQVLLGRKLHEIYPVVCVLAAGQALMFEPEGLHHIPYIKGLRCRDLHDHVYALLGILPNSLGMVPDYTKSWTEVYREFSYQLISKMGTLDPLRMVLSNPALPSWVLDLSLQNDENSATQLIGNIFFASGVSRTKARLDDDALIVPGLFLGQVTRTVIQHDALPELLVYEGPRYKARMLHVLRKIWQIDETDDLADLIDKGISLELLRTFLQDKVEPGYHYDAARTRRMTDWELIEGKRLFDAWLKDETGAHNKFTYYLAVLLHKLLPIMIGDDQLGLGNDEILVGDHICLLAGSRVPFCVRPVIKDGRTCYKLISACYVDGIMDGQALYMRREELKRVGRQEPIAVDDLFEEVRLV